MEFLKEHWLILLIGLIVLVFAILKPWRGDMGEQSLLILRAGV